MGRKLVLLFICFIILLPVMIVIVDLFSISVSISGGNIIRTIGNKISVGLESARTGFGSFFTSGPFDPALREIWAVVLVVAIVVITFLKGRR